MTGATGRNADFHGERIPTRTHAPVTRRGITAVVWVLIVAVCVTFCPLVILAVSAILNKLASLFGGAA